METDLIAELANTATMRATLTCRVDIAKAVGNYRSAHNNRINRLQLSTEHLLPPAHHNIGSPFSQEVIRVQLIGMDASKVRRVEL